MFLSVLCELSCVTVCLGMVCVIEYSVYLLPCYFVISAYIAHFPLPLPMMHGTSLASSRLAAHSLADGSFFLCVGRCRLNCAAAAARATGRRREREVHACHLLYSCRSLAGHPKSVSVFIHCTLASRAHANSLVSR